MMKRKNVPASFVVSLTAKPGHGRFGSSARCVITGHTRSALLACHNSYVPTVTRTTETERDIDSSCQTEFVIILTESKRQ